MMFFDPQRLSNNRSRFFQYALKVPAPARRWEWIQMEQKIVLMAETGSDITPELAEEYGIFLVPMHVSMGDRTLDDGAFPPEDVCAYYNATGKVP